MNKEFFNEEFTNKLKKDGWEKTDAGRSRRINYNDRAIVYVKRGLLGDKKIMSPSDSLSNDAVSRGLGHTPISCKKSWEGVSNICSELTPNSLTYLNDIRINSDRLTIIFDCLWNYNSTSVISYNVSVIHLNFIYTFLIFPFSDIKSFITINYILGFVFDYLNLNCIHRDKCTFYKYINKLNSNNKPIVEKCPSKSEALKLAKYAFINNNPSNVLINKVRLQNNEFCKVLTCYDNNDFETYDVSLVLFNGLNLLSSLNSCFDSNDNILSNIYNNLVELNHGVFSFNNFNVHFNSIKNNGWKYIYNANICIRDIINHDCLDADDNYSIFGKSVGLNLTDFSKTKFDVNFYKLLDKVLEFNPVVFSKYAYERNLCFIKYISSVWGINKEIPRTLISEVCNLAKAKIQESLHIDDDEYLFKYAGVSKKSNLTKSKNNKFYRRGKFFPINDDCDMLQRYASYAYRGGYNECFSVDLHLNHTTFDVDIASAYPTFMTMIPAIDWSNPIKERISNKALTFFDFVNDDGTANPMAPVFAYVTYDFPDDCLYPNLPGSNSDTPYYPLHEENGVYCCGPELYVALMKGAKINVINGVIANTLKDENWDVIYPYRNLVSELVKARSLFEKGSLYEKLLKLMVNSLYGKISQYVSKMYSDTTEKGYESIITNSVSASLITSSVRAVLFSAFDEIAKNGYHTYSVTTDGLITDMPFEKFKDLELNGLKSIMTESRQIMTGTENPEVWSVKHIQNDLLNLSTRKNASLIIEDKENDILGGVIAMGVSKSNPYESKETLENRSYYYYNAISRTGPVDSVTKSYTKISDVASGLPYRITENPEHISLDYDMKRKPVESSLTAIITTCGNDEIEFAHVETAPYENYEEFILYRSARQRFKCLRTVAEWKSFFNTVQTMSKGTKAFDYSNESQNWKLFCDCISGYRAGLWDIPYLNNPSLLTKDKIAWIQSKNPCASHIFNGRIWDKTSEKQRQTKIADIKYIEPILDYLNTDDSTIPEPVDLFTESNIEETDFYEDEFDFFDDEFGLPY